MGPYFSLSLSTLLRLLVLAACCLLSITGQAATIPAQEPQADSLEQLYFHAPPAQKQQYLQELVLHYLPDKPELALHKSQQALELAKEIQSPQGQAFALIQLGNAIRYLLHDYDSSLYYYREALAVSRQQNLTREQLNAFLAIGDIYQEAGNSYKAIEHYMQAQVLAESLRLQRMAVEVLNRTGKVYASIGNESKAVRHHTKALQLSQEHQYGKGIADSHYWLALAYQDQGNLNQALQQLQLAADLRGQMNDQPGLGACELARARILLAQKEYNKAEAILEKGLQRFRQLGLITEQANAYNLIGMLQIEQMKYQQALSHLQQALNIGEMRNDKKIIRDSYENLYACYSALKDYEQALKYKDLYVAISDFIYGEENERRMAELQTRFEISEKEREIELLKIDNELRDLAIQKQTNFRNFLITGMVLLIIILLLIVYLYRNNRQNNQQLRHTNKTIHQQNQELQELNATKDKFFSIISHDLKSPLNSLTAFSGLLINHADALSREEIQMLATDLDKSLKNLLSLLENLLEWSRAQTNQMEVEPEALPLRELVQANVDLLQKMADNKKIRIHTNVPLSTTAMAGRNQLNAVLRNLISNAVKFTETGGRVTISAVEWKDMVEVSVQDTGVGISKNVMDKLFRIEHKHSSNGTANEKGTGLGLMLCKEFIEQHGGQLSVDSKEGIGSTFRFTVPIADIGQEKALPAL